MFVWLLRQLYRSWKTSDVTVLQKKCLINQVAVKDQIDRIIKQTPTLDRPLIIRFHMAPFISSTGGRLTLEVTAWKGWFFNRYQIDISLTVDYLEQLTTALTRLTHGRLIASD